MAKMRIKTEKLREGMVLADSVCTLLGVTLVTKGTVLNNANIMKIEQNNVSAVYVEKGDEAENIPKVVTFIGNEKESERRLNEFKEIFVAAKKEIKQTISDIVYTEKDVDVEGMLENVNKLSGNTYTNMELMDMIGKMRDKNENVFNHSLNVALICHMLGKWMRMAEKDIDVLVISALLHDVGRLKLPDELAEKSHGLSAHEKNVYKKHAIYGYNILKDKNLDVRIAQVALGHHERQDGSGYPLEKSGFAIDEFSRIVAIADVFDTMSDDYEFYKGGCVFDVIRMFETDGYTKFDPEALLVFLSKLADTYINYRVKLSDGKTGKIVFANKGRPSCPMVKVGERYIDLALENNLKIIDLLEKQT